MLLAGACTAFMTAVMPVASAVADEPPFSAACPPTVHCVVVPAPYVANDGNVEDYGNFDRTNRPTDMTIDKIVIHDTEGSLKDTLEHFQDTHVYASVQYVVDTDGTVYQMVRNKDMGWHAGNWWFNMHSIGIEHIGHAADPSGYTSAMYEASAKLVKYLTGKYGIPRDRGHIIGHDNVPASKSADIAGMHVDPGPFWNWQKYMTLIGAPVLPHGNTGSLVTVAPVWPLSKELVTGCTSGSQSCVPSGSHATNFVYLRTEPRSDAPLISDPVMGSGDTTIPNNAARLFYGQTVAVAKRQVVSQGVWYQVWVNGVQGWFISPYAAPTAFPTSGQYITPKSGMTSVPVYGRPIPERSEYPADLLAVPPASWYIPTPTPLTYAVGAGQKYRVVDATVPTDHFYAWASDSSFPYDHTAFKGVTRYLEIQLGNRTGFVKRDDVTVVKP